MVMPYHLHMPSYFLETFTEYPMSEESVYNNSFIVYRFFTNIQNNRNDRIIIQQSIFQYSVFQH